MSQKFLILHTCFACYKISPGGGGTQFIVCCRPRILMPKLTPKQVFSSPKQETLSPFLSPYNILFKDIFTKEDPFHVLLDHAHIVLADLDCRNHKDQDVHKSRAHTSQTSLVMSWRFSSIFQTSGGLSLVLIPLLKGATISRPYIHVI